LKALGFSNAVMGSSPTHASVTFFRAVMSGLLPDHRKEDVIECGYRLARLDAAAADP
jgi:hypothetical protein